MPSTKKKKPAPTTRTHAPAVRSPRDEHLHMRVRWEDKNAWRAAAYSTDARDLSDWITKTLNAAAKAATTEKR